MRTKGSDFDKDSTLTDAHIHIHTQKNLNVICLDRTNVSCHERHVKFVQPREMWGGSLVENLPVVRMLKIRCIQKPV